MQHGGDLASIIRIVSSTILWPSEGGGEGVVGWATKGQQTPSNWKACADNSSAFNRTWLNELEALFDHDGGRVSSGSDDEVLPKSKKARIDADP